MLVGNIGGATMTSGLWQKWTTPLDGSEEESWTDGGAGLAQQISQWPAKLANVAWSEANGKLTILHSYNTTETGNTYGLASMLLATAGRSNYSTANGNYTSYEAWYPEYTTARHSSAPPPAASSSSPAGSTSGYSTTGSCWSTRPPRPPARSRWEGQLHRLGLDERNLCDAAVGERFDPAQDRLISERVPSSRYRRRRSSAGVVDRPQLRADDLRSARLDAELLRALSHRRRIGTVRQIPLQRRGQG